MARRSTVRLSLQEVVDSFLADSDSGDEERGLGNEEYDPADNDLGDSDWEYNADEGDSSGDDDASKCLITLQCIIARNASHSFHVISFHVISFHFIL
jgi:hypothetical protein